MNDKIANLMTSLDVTRKGAERIADIVKVNAAILLDEGFTSLTKRRIAKRLSISHGNVSYYFPTRDSLINQWRVNYYVCDRNKARQTARFSLSHVCQGELSYE